MLDQFSAVRVVDFEFRSSGGNLPEPVCYVARDLDGGEERVWLEDTREPPTWLSEDALVVAYYASAEVGCLLELGWPVPRILDLYTEFRNYTNGKRLRFGSGLLGACAYFGIADSSKAEKDKMRKIILENTRYTPRQKRDILQYCADDVFLTERLLVFMRDHLDWPRALFRGKYMEAVARIERRGIPIDVEMLDELRDAWGMVKLELIQTADRWDLFDGTVFKIDRFREFLEEREIAWELTPTGAPRTDQDYMRSQAKLHPEIEVIQELRHALGQLKLERLDVGSDGRNRCLLSPFRSKTGRNQPSTNRFIFGPAKWLRFLIKPEMGKALAYVDYEQQEILIAGALSGDRNLLRDYQTGDPYLAFAKAAKAIPKDGSREEYKEIRDIYKRCMLAVNYGMSVRTFAASAGVDESKAEQVMEWHRHRYRKYWQWQDQFVAEGLDNRVESVMGWQFFAYGAKRRTLMNWPMQAAGAEMLRLAIVLCEETGVEIVAPVHDAILIEASIEEIEERVVVARDNMNRASELTLGQPIRSDVLYVRYPDRYREPRGQEMWDSVSEILSRTRDQRMAEMATQVVLDFENSLETVRRSGFYTTAEQKMMKRIRKKSGLNYLQVKHLVDLARDYDFDMEHEVDWSLGYDHAKATILEGVQAMKRKSMKELNKFDI